jgi:hypothetical protein
LLKVFCDANDATIHGIPTFFGVGWCLILFKNGTVDLDDPILDKRSANVNA